MIFLQNPRQPSNGNKIEILNCAWSHIPSAIFLSACGFSFAGLFQIKSRRLFWRRGHWKFLLLIRKKFFLPIQFTSFLRHSSRRQKIKNFRRRRIRGLFENTRKRQAFEIVFQKIEVAIFASLADACLLCRHIFSLVFVWKFVEMKRRGSRFSGQPEFFNSNY